MAKLMTATEALAGLSGEARRMLQEASGTHQGAAVHMGLYGSRADNELRDRGLVGPGDGLTMRGSIVAALLRRQLEEEMFG